MPPYANLLNRMMRATEAGIINRFAGLPGAAILRTSYGDGCFVPATGPGPRVLLVAHTDTVWSPSRVNPVYDRSLGFLGGFRSGTRGIGIGADDRAGCAALWSLRDLSNASLLLVPAEEAGCCGSRAIMSSDAALDEIGDHAFAIQFDRRGTRDLVFYDLDSDSDFIAYASSSMGGPYEEAMGSYSDITEICPAMGIAGVNISIGFFDEHTPRETQDIAAFIRTIDRVRGWLSGGDLQAHPYETVAVTDYRYYPNDDDDDYTLLKEWYANDCTP